MIGLRFTRVIIIDDNEQDGIAIARALWRARLAPLYFAGPGDVMAATEKLRGVRLALLDMDLLGMGAGTDETSKFSALAASLRAILDEKNGPYIAVAWTLHRELVEGFTTYIEQQTDVPKPVRMFRLEKSAFSDGDGGYDLEKLLDELNKQLQEYSGLELVRAWEEESFVAASLLVNDLSDLAKQNAAGTQEWDANLRRIECAIANGVAGTTKESDGGAIARAFFGGLAPLHADRLELGFTDIITRVTPHCGVLKDDAAHGALSIDQRASLNTMLHCSFEEPDDFRHGNVYVGNTATKHIRDLNALQESLFQPKTDDNHQKLVLEHAIPIVIEANAACDHIQKKVRQPRLIAGYLIDETKMNGARLQPKNTQSMWRLGPLRLTIDGDTRNYTLIANLLYTDGAGKNDFDGVKALFRIRTEAFGDLQATLSRHVGRPGMVQL